jgi:hypothetical protein
LRPIATSKFNFAQSIVAFPDFFWKPASGLFAWRSALPIVFSRFRLSVSALISSSPSSCFAQIVPYQPKASAIPESIFCSQPQS